jgi:prevent-host-death family protein
MKIASVSELRQNLQAFLAAAASGQRVRITSHGRVIAEITPPKLEPEKAVSARVKLRGTVLKFSKPTESAFDPSEWDMNR